MFVLQDAEKWPADDWHACAVEVKAETETCVCVCVQASANLGPDTTQTEGANASWHNGSSRLQTLVPCTTCAVYASHADVYSTYLRLFCPAWSMTRPSSWL